MKKFFVIKLLLASLLALSACGNRKTIDGVTYDTFGIVNDNEKRNPNIEYEVSIGSVVVAVIFVETIIIPAYIVGWDFYQPVGKRGPIKGQVQF